MNVAIIRAEPLIGHEGFLALIEVRNAINNSFTKQEFLVSQLCEENMSSIPKEK